MQEQNSHIIIKIAKRALTTGALLAFYTLLPAQDMVADNMLLHQRTYGGWPKHFDDNKIDYTYELTEAEKKAIAATANDDDATIDNSATTKEIKYLLKAYKQHQNPAYLQGAEKGIRYLLKAQYKNGGWPQFYPDFSKYHGQVTYNDNAMVNVLNLLQDIVEEKNNTAVLNDNLLKEVQAAISKGVECILNTQIKVKKVPTGWCAQYDQHTLRPATARKYELPSISGMESVGIVQFLMRLPNPSPEVVAAVDNAVNWFNTVAIKGYKSEVVADPKQPGGKNRVLMVDENSTIWARFYDIDTNQPFFCGRDGIKKDKLEEIEVERRVGYAWYGSWAKDLVNKHYPKWKQNITSN